MQPEPTPPPALSRAHRAAHELARTNVNAFIQQTRGRLPWDSEHTDSGVTVVSGRCTECGERIDFAVPEDHLLAQAAHLRRRARQLRENQRTADEQLAERYASRIDFIESIAAELEGRI